MEGRVAYRSRTAQGNIPDMSAATTDGAIIGPSCRRGLCANRLWTSEWPLASRPGPRCRQEEHHGQLGCDLYRRPRGLKPTDDDRKRLGLFAAGSTVGGLDGGPNAGYVGGLIKATIALRAAEAIAAAQRACARWRGAQFMSASCPLCGGEADSIFSI